MAEIGKLTFPIVEVVNLTAFSLYNLEPNIQLEVPKGVFCLAGANGLGKSTFLAALNYAITGIVPDPNQDFKSVDEYYRFGIAFSKEFFAGRINALDSDSATIGVRLVVGHIEYLIVRGAFEPDQLRELTIADRISGEVYVADGMNGGQRNQIYQDRIAQDIGVKSFEQFVFLQHFILTFDERRHLLFWDQRVMTQALYLSIGSDFSKAEEADQLRREMERTDSRARNLTYQASTVRARITDILRTMQQIETIETETLDLEALQEKYEALHEDVDRAQQLLETKKHQLDDCTLQWMDINSQLSALQTEYTEVFSHRLLQRSAAAFHPLIASSLSERICAVCGNKSSEAINNIELKLESHRCPLCESEIQEVADTEEAIQDLQLIDQRMNGVRQQLAEVTKTRQRLTQELEETQAVLSANEERLKIFESSNEQQLSQINAQQGTADSKSELQAVVDKLESEATQYRQRSREEYAKRDQKKNDLVKLQRELEGKYLAVETEFVPLFKDLAILFLGIDLDIRMSTTNTANLTGVTLVLDVRGSTRREMHQLSESQRFFLDIALRMALARYMSTDNGKASLIIDTPEGSLDIAYESRAGQMFASFVNLEHSIIMTANINSSQLLLKLATGCGHQKMKLHPMTSWTELSEVQVEEAALFQNAYDAIEHALHAGTGR